MNNIIMKITLLIAIFSFPLLTLAMNCAPNDIQCRQLKTMQKSGIKPTKLVEPQTSNDNKASEQLTESQSYMIPPPGLHQNETEEESSNDGAQEARMNQGAPINIFAPNTNKATKGRFKLKQLQPITKKSTGIY